MSANVEDYERYSIRALRIRNFKCFEDQILSFAPLTLLTGLNSSGKSSVLQALLLLRQSYQQGLLDTTGLALNGDLTNIGTARDALFENADEEMVGFDLVLSEERAMNWKWHYTLGNEAEELNTDVMNLTERNGDQEVYRANLFTDNFHNLQAERIGPRNFFETSDFQVRQHKQIGSRGQYTAHFLSVFGRNAIANNTLSHSNARTSGLQDQVEAWLGEVSPGTRISSLTRYPGMDFISLQYAYVLGKQLSSNYRPTNIGFGITYVLPILVAILSSKPGSLLLIENPEAHLHPKGQVQMGNLLALAASCGIQIIGETHSDHILNGIRLAVHDGKLPPADVQLHFLQRNAQDGVAQVTSPRMDRDGRIDQWPDDFFDEWEKVLFALLEPRG
jgi:predicted ATPase